MTPPVNSRPRSATRSSPCFRHPDESLPGICPSCIRERLSSLEPAGASAAQLDSPDLRRCRSVSVSQFDATFSRCGELRRKSCDSVPGEGGTSLSRLFDADDVRGGVSKCEAGVESKNAGLSRITYTLIGNGGGDGIRVPRDQVAEESVDLDEGEFKTMKEFIDLEFGKKIKKSKDLREIAGNFFGAASVLSKKLRIWGQKNKTKKLSSSSNCNVNSCTGNNNNTALFDDRRRSVDLGRRSCDSESRFSIDAGQVSYDEPRASWDGYMIARSIPRLAPMFSLVDNNIFSSNNRFENQRLSVDRPMHSIMEDECSSGVSGLGSGHSNSDSSSSMRGSSFDRSSSARSIGKKVGNLGEQGPAPANAKLVITERELNDWHLTTHGNECSQRFGSCSRNATAAKGAGNSNLPKMNHGRHKVSNALHHKCNSVENKLGNFEVNVINTSGDGSSGRDLNEVTNWKLTRSRSVVGSNNSREIIGSTCSRRSVDNADEHKGMGKYKMEVSRSPSLVEKDLESGIPPFYLTPSRNVRSNKYGKFKPQKSYSVTGKFLHFS